MVFPTVMYGWESWTIKNAEHQSIDAWTVVLEKTFKSPLECKEIKPVNPKRNQSWIFIGRTDAEAQILWPPDVKTQLIRKDLTLGKIKGRRRRGWQRMRWLDGTTDWMDMNLSKLQEMVKDREAWLASVRGVARTQTWLSDWTMSSLQLKMEKLYTASKKKTWSWLWLRSSAPFCKIQAQTEESRENH